MEHSEYEIRNSEVQEIMQRPPNILVMYGNVFILVSILIGIYFLNFIQLTEKQRFQFQIIEINKLQNFVDSTDLILSVNVNVSQKIQPGQMTHLIINNFPQKTYLGTITKVEQQQNSSPHLYVKCSNMNGQLKSGMIGEVIVSIKNRSLFDLTMNRLKI